MKSYFRSDLALEELENLHTDVVGAKRTERHVGRFFISKLCIGTESAARSLNKDVGNYLTLHCGPVTELSCEDEALLVRLVAGEIQGMARCLTGKPMDGAFSVLIVGLGNAELTADAIGPLTVRGLTATRHWRSEEEDLYHALGCTALSTFVPGVLGQTGIESLALLQGALAAAKPDLVVIVDALAAGECRRLASTVQISDTGIVPGSGVGCHRERIDAASLGVPVISIGVPTVVDSSTLVWDALLRAGIQDIGAPLHEVLENGRNFLVSPKDIDRVTEVASAFLTRALSLAFLGEHFRTDV